MPDKKSKNKEPLWEEMSSESIEDTTMYDEFIPSFHLWIPSEVQKEKAHELEKPVE